MIFIIQDEKKYEKKHNYEVRFQVCNLNSAGLSLWHSHDFLSSGSVRTHLHPHRRAALNSLCSLWWRTSLRVWTKRLTTYSFRFPIPMWRKVRWVWPQGCFRRLAQFILLLPLSKALIRLTLVALARRTYRVSSNSTVVQEASKQSAVSSR